MYFHHIQQSAGKLKSQRYEVIDGQQRINALSDYYEGAFKLYDPVEDEAEARFPDFVKRQPCPWGRKSYQDLNVPLKQQFLDTSLRIVQIETADPNEARDLFVRLQAGMPLNSQEKRDAWPGQFTDFILRLGGKAGIARYPGHDFFSVIMRGNRTQDRGKFRQLAAQIAMLYFARRNAGDSTFCDINSPAIDDFYYENLGFDASSPDAVRFVEILDKLTELLRDQKRSKILGHEAIHLVLVVDSLWDDYTRSWTQHFPAAFDDFRIKFSAAKNTRYDAIPDEYWLSYGNLTRVNSDRGDTIQRRHEFFANKMRLFLNPQMKDPQRGFGLLEREIIYYRDKKCCGECGAEVVWQEAEIHHVQQHSKAGPTSLQNGALVHKHCHPKGPRAEEAFAKKWKARSTQVAVAPATGIEINGDDDDDEENGNSI